MRPLAALVAVLVLVACGEDPGPPQPPTGDESPAATPTPAPPDDDPGGTPATADWTRFPDAPEALSEVGAAALGGQVWTAGGFAGSGEAVTTVQVFDPTFETWSAGPSLPEPVHHAALASDGRSLYLLGGYTGSGFDAPTATVRRLDPATGAWEAAPSLPAARAAGAAAWDGERLVYGGGVGPGGLAGDVFALEDGAWAPIGSLTEPREHLAAASDGQGRTWFLAGRAGGLDANLGTVDLAEGGALRSIGEVPTARGGVAGFWSPVVGACVVGGEDPQATFDEVECIDAGGTVTVLPPLPRPRHGLGAAVVEGVAYVVLGGPEPRLTVSGATEGLPVDR